MKMRARTPATVLRVIDGDTLLIRLTCPCCRIVSEQRLRLSGIDAPELDGPKRLEAEASKGILANLVEGKHVEVLIVRQWPDRYGRVLGRVYCEGQDVNQRMVDLGAATVYPPDKLIV